MKKAQVDKGVDDSCWSCLEEKSRIIEYTEQKCCAKKADWNLRVLFVWYCISTIVGNLMLNLFLYNLSALFKTIQFSMNTQANCQKHFYFKLLSFVK